MKRTFQLVFLIFVFFAGIGFASAAPSKSFYSSSKTIESGARVTATLQLKNVAAWNIKITSNGSTSGCDSSFADASSNGLNTTKNLSVTCTSTGVGQISFRASGDATSQDGSTASINEVIVVTVTAPREKDTNNNLKSIGVKDYKITPEFNKDTLEYSVDVPSTIDKVTLEAEAESGYANVAGTGEVEVNEGANSFDIVVTSETGNQKNYKITVNVKDDNPIKLNLNSRSFTLIKNVKNIIKPETYEETKVTINNFEIPAFYSDITKYTLVGIKDENGKQFLAIYNKDTKEYQLYNEHKTSGMLLYIMDLKEQLEGYQKVTLELDNQSYDALKVQEQSPFYLVYAMNIETGEKGYYVYHKKSDTFQEYNDELVLKLEQEKAVREKIILGLGIGVIFFLFLSIFAFVHKSHKKEKMPILEDEKIAEEQMNQLEENQKKEEKELKKEEKVIPEKLYVKDAVQKMNDVEKMIDEYEKTVSLSKQELKEEKKTLKEEIEQTTYDLFEDEKKKKKRK